MLSTAEAQLDALSQAGCGEGPLPRTRQVPPRLSRCGVQKALPRTPQDGGGGQLEDSPGRPTTHIRKIFLVNK